MSSSTIDKKQHLTLLARHFNMHPSLQKKHTKQLLQVVPTKYAVTCVPTTCRRSYLRAHQREVTAYCRNAWIAIME